MEVSLPPVAVPLPLVELGQRRKFFVLLMSDPLKLNIAISRRLQPPRDFMLHEASCPRPTS